MRFYTAVRSTVTCVLQLADEGLSNLWWTPADCSGATVPILMSSITYDITPPTLAIIKKTGKINTTLAQTTVSTTTATARRLRRNGRKLQYFTLSTTSDSSVTYGANVVVSFSEAVEGFAEEYAFVSGGALSSSGFNETVSQQQYSATIVADNTKSSLVTVTGSEFRSSSFRFDQFLHGSACTNLLHRVTQALTQSCLIFSCSCTCTHFTSTLLPQMPGLRCLEHESPNVKQLCTANLASHVIMPAGTVGLMAR